jgi:cytochrome c peroxidase
VNLRLIAAAAALLVTTALAGREGKIELGRRLFMDPTVSRGARFSCASCHDPEHGFSDARVRSADENGETARHSQTLLDLKDGVGMHWDGEFFRVRDLLVARLGSLAEARQLTLDLAHRHFAAARGRGERSAFDRRVAEARPPYYEGADATVVFAAPLARRLEEEGRYGRDFTRAFGSKRVTTERLADAMEAYVLSLRSGESAYDRYVAGDEEALSDSAQRGLALFKERANCASCHAMDGRRARFTDDSFHNTGASFLVPGGDAGLSERSFVKDDHGRFKTPTLRDVARRAPYMHNGQLATLKDVVHYYSRGGIANPNLDPHVERLDLDEREADDLVAFLESLTSDDRPGLGPVSRARPRETRVRIEDIKGNPMAGLAVRVVPFGDRLGGAPGREARTVETDGKGILRFRFPDWTHVTLEADGLALGEGAPLPDSTREATVIAAPAGSTAVRIKADGSLPDLLAVHSKEFGLVVLAKERRIDRHEALYMAGRDIRGSAVVTFKELPAGAVSRRYAMEFGRGFTQAIDLRPDPEGPAPRTPSATPAPAEVGGRPTQAQARAAERANQR